LAALPVLVVVELGVVTGIAVEVSSTTALARSLVHCLRFFVPAESDRHFRRSV
jgi:hypothetical protein